MTKCIHKLGISLHHPNSIETQIQIATRIKPLELFQWTTGNLEGEGPVREETLIFVIQQAHLGGDDSAVINDLAVIVHNKVRTIAGDQFQYLLPKERMEGFLAEVAERFWFRLFDPDDADASRAQISFRSFVIGIGSKLLKKEKRQQRRCPSLDSDTCRKKALRYPAPTRISLDDKFLVYEALQVLNADQQTAFTSAHYFGLTVREIAAAAHCTERTVYNRLRAAKNNLHRVIN